MRTDAVVLTAVLAASAAMSGCAGGASGIQVCCTPITLAPTILTAVGPNGVQNGAMIVTLTTGGGASIYYTVDGSTPTTSSQFYEAPFLVSSSLTVNAIAASAGQLSTVATQTFNINIPSGTLVWSDEFLNSTATPTQPDPTVWTYDTGNSGFGNNELENYCAWGSSTSPCSTTSPSEYVGSYPGTDGVLYIVAQQPSSGVYTSARLKSQGLFSFQYGRLEVRAQVPEYQGFWPAAWLMGNNIATLNWPACGEQDVMERVNVALAPDWNQGSIHGTGFTGADLGTTYYFPTGQTAGGEFHNYGMIWSPGSVVYYVDDPNSPYATFTTSSISGLAGAVWPFDAGQSNFILLNLAIGGDFPGSPDGTTVFPSEMLVDYVRVYTN
jgi:beta-glucanase (GH16 family)